MASHSSVPLSSTSSLGPTRYTPTHLPRFSVLAQVWVLKLLWLICFSIRCSIRSCISKFCNTSYEVRIGPFLACCWSCLTSSFGCLHLFALLSPPPLPCVPPPGALSPPLPCSSPLPRGRVLSVVCAIDHFLYVLSIHFLYIIF